MTYFLDSNVFMYAVGGPHALKEPCLGVLAQLVTRKLDAVTNAEVIQEVLYRYAQLDQRPRGMAIAQWALRSVSRVLPVTAGDMRGAIVLMRIVPGLPPRDAVHATTALNAGITHIVSADKHFDAIPDVTRVDPMDLVS